MLKVAKRVVYRAFGLSIVSEIPLPELPQIEDEIDEIDLEIRIEDLSTLWNSITDKQNNLIINDKFVMFRVPEAATFSIHEGKKIIVSPTEEYDEDLVRLYILGSCMGVTLMQRKIYPLHGSAIAINGKAYAIVGDSGAGKSTLASAFLNRGYQLISDDVIAVSFPNDHGLPFVTPAYPQQKLWQESLIEFGVETSQFRSIHGRETKFCVPVSSQFYSDSLPLAGIFELTKTDNDHIKICKVKGLQRLNTLYTHTYRNFLIPNLDIVDWHFNTSARILESVDLFKLSRPMTGFSAPDLVSIILNVTNKGE
ncbi:aldolase [Neobacillus vireti]|uniref:aldolase n=1 Tax=Neobacillus vireti TaxID=220686 RepID=UPI002FFFE9DF